MESLFALVLGRQQRTLSRLQSTDNSYHFDGAIDAIQVCMPAVQRQPTCEGLISQLAASEGPRSALPEIIPLPHLPIRADANVAGTGRCCCRCR